MTVDISTLSTEELQAGLISELNASEEEEAADSEGTIEETEETVQTEEETVETAEETVEEEQPKKK